MQFVFKEMSFRQQIGLKFREETNEMLHLERSFACGGKV
jgi:hypothetical protein